MTVRTRTLRFSPAVESGGCSRLPNSASMLLRTKRWLNTQESCDVSRPINQWSKPRKLTQTHTHTHIYIYIYIYTYVYTHTCTSTRTCTCTRTSQHVHEHERTSTRDSGSCCFQRRCSDVLACNKKSLHAQDSMACRFQLLTTPKKTSSRR